jgi:hypothetical protein
MLKNENNGAAPQRLTDAISDYENAVREFSTNAAEFLKQVPLLTSAREAYERANLASTQLREILDRGDETLHLFMAQIEETITSPQLKGVFGGAKLEPEKSPAIKAGGEKADVARA